MGSNDTHVAQVGGDHYQADYQHWDWVAEFRIGYLEGNATKYMSRWRKKNGLQDLEKARSYVEKIRALVKAGKLTNHVHILDWTAFQYATKYLMDKIDLPTTAEQVFMVKLATWRDVHDLDHCLSLLNMTVALANEQAVARAMAAQGGATGAASPAPATTLAGQGAGAMPAAPHGAAQGATGQAPATAGPTAAQISRSRGLVGLEHPFGYDEEQDA